MASRYLGRKATIFTEGVQILKTEWIYRPIFSLSSKILTLMASSRRIYWENKFYRAKKSIHEECYKRNAPKRLLGLIK